MRLRLDAVVTPRVPARGERTHSSGTQADRPTRLTVRGRGTGGTRSGVEREPVDHHLGSRALGRDTNQHC